jgi:hypothetical protein
MIFEERLSSAMSMPIEDAPQLNKFLDRCGSKATIV